MEMPDREKVIKGWETVLSRDPLDAPWDLIDETLALLKEQDVVEPFHKCKGKSFSLIEDSNYDYCPYCGKPITWDKQEGR